MEESIFALYDKFLISTGVCTDTRLLQDGQMFFALKGPNFNGNLYAEKALREGAQFVVIDEPEYGVESDVRYILVEEVLPAMQKLANHHRKQFDIPFLAITGSNGKTTTKELMARAVGEERKVQFTLGNLNNHIGVPLTLLSIKKDTEFAIIEMGANHLGDISELCEMAEPTHGLITNIGTAHIGEFGGKENLIRAKSELFDYLRKTNGVPFINKIDTVLMNMSKRFANGVSYPNDSCKLVEASPFVNYADERNEEHTTSMIGEYNYMNIAAAVTVAKYFEVEDPYSAIDHYLPDNNRSQILELGTNTVVLDAYNANPDSMSAALQNLANMDGDSKIAMLGEMKELGSYTVEEHKKIITLIETLGIDKVYLVGSEFANASNRMTVVPHVDDLVERLGSETFSGSTVLIKGSRSMLMEKLTKIKELWA
ncbi:MAG: UDP-N-acetylmuramoyl-tripeptide--D-alanyl-D-alanine ligase [Reichenbachiella sp.]